MESLLLCFEKSPSSKSMSIPGFADSNEWRLAGLVLVAEISFCFGQRGFWGVI